MLSINLPTEVMCSFGIFIGAVDKRDLLAQKLESFFIR